jgi:hypothetical protein
VKKKCRKCQKIKNIEEFALAKTCKDGRRQTCNDCRSKKLAEWYQKDKENIQVKRRPYREKNKEKINENTKQWKRDNKEYTQEYNADWRKDNPDKINAYAAKRRAALLNATPPWLTKNQLKQIERYYTVAQWAESILGEPLAVDHIVPLQGKNVNGLHVPWNLQIITKQENERKGNKVK